MAQWTEQPIILKIPVSHRGVWQEPCHLPARTSWTTTLAYFCNREHAEASNRRERERRGYWQLYLTLDPVRRCFPAVFSLVIARRGNVFRCQAPYYNGRVCVLSFRVSIRRERQRPVVEFVLSQVTSWDFEVVPI